MAIRSWNPWIPRIAISSGPRILRSGVAMQAPCALEHLRKRWTTELPARRNSMILEAPRFDQLVQEYGNAIEGVWEDNRPGLASRYMLLEDDGTLVFEQVFDDGSSRRFEVVEAESPLGQRLEEPENQFGEYFLIRDGHLEMRDQEGLIFSAPPVDP